MTIAKRVSPPVSFVPPLEVELLSQQIYWARSSTGPPLASSSFVGHPRLVGTVSTRLGRQLLSDQFLAREWPARARVLTLDPGWLSAPNTQLDQAGSIES
jgi:hypothetical protein